MKKIYLIFILVLALQPVTAQQDPQFNLYQFNQLAVNPAYAGARDAITIVADMRKQWVSFPGAPTTLAFTAHAPVSNNKLGIGINMLSDQIGAKSTTGMYGNVSYILKLNNKFRLSFGLRAGFINYRFNFTKVNYKDMNEAAAAELTNINRNTFDLDAGIYLRSNSFYIGLSSTHLNHAAIYDKNYEVTNSTTGQSQNINASYILVPHYFLTMGKAFSINENLVFSPSVMIRALPSSVSGDLNLNFLIYKRLWLGAFAKWNNGAGILVQVYATEKLRIGYTYDVAIGSKYRLGSSHELMIGFDLKNHKTKTLSPRFL